MDIDRILRDVGKFGAKILLNKEEQSSKQININQFGSKEVLPILLKRLVYEGNYNKAENILFKELNNNPVEVYPIAEDFYNLLLEKSEEELRIGNFSREEIFQGLEDIRKFKP